MGILKGFPPSQIISPIIKIGPNDLVNWSTIDLTEDWSDDDLYIDEFGKLRQVKKKKKYIRQITEPFVVSMDQ